MSDVFSLQDDVRDAVLALIAEHAGGGGVTENELTVVNNYVDYAVAMGGQLTSSTFTILQPQSDGEGTTITLDVGNRILGMSYRIIELGAPVDGETTDWGLDLVRDGGAPVLDILGWGYVVQGAITDFVTLQNTLLVNTGTLVFTWHAGSYPTSAPPFPQIEIRVVYRDEWGDWP